MSADNSLADKAVALAARGSALLCGLLVLLIAGFVAHEAAPAVAEVGVARFFSDADWRPAPSADGLFNMTPLLLGTAATTFGAILLAGPLGVALAVFRRYYAPPRVAVGLGLTMAIAAGVPSVVYGLWALETLAPRLGQNALSGSLLLAMMILPTVAVAADAALANVDGEIWRGAAALGFRRWGAVWRLVLPAAWSGVAAGVLLAVVRAMGETMAVLMICGNAVRLPGSPLESVRTLTANIALEMAYAEGIHRSALFAGGLLLLLAVTATVALADWLIWRKRRAAGTVHTTATS